MLDELGGSIGYGLAVSNFGLDILIESKLFRYSDSLRNVGGSTQEPARA